MFVTKKKYQEMSVQCDTLKNECRELDVKNTKLTSQNVELTVTNSELLNRITELENLVAEKTEEAARFEELSLKSDVNEVILQIEDDLTTIIPIIRWKDGTPEKLIEAGYITDVSNSRVATQVALMMIGGEALEEIIESFTQPIKEGE